VVAQLGRQTLIMSIDPAQPGGIASIWIMTSSRSDFLDPFPISDRLRFLELNTVKEIKRHWQEISSYVVPLVPVYHRDKAAWRPKNWPFFRHGRTERHDVHQSVPARTAV